MLLNFIDIETICAIINQSLSLANNLTDLYNQNKDQII